jgi:acetolactate synthase-1/2/3 large subunit
VNDPSLGAFADLLPRADLILLLGKKHDFTLRFAEPPFVDAGCRFMVVDPEAEAVERVAREKRDRLVLSVLADAGFAADQLSKAGWSRDPGDAWYREATRAIAYRPPEWEAPRSSDSGGVDPVTLCKTIDRTLREAEKPLFICDGGEIGQWGQCLVGTPRRIINGVAGSIGAAIPFALGARAADPQATIIALSGDGAFGFHMAEFDTAVRYGLAFVAVIGNDAAWNAEHQIQLRTYGAQRAHGCELLPTRYDEVVKALGGHGELVTTADQLLPALERAIQSGKPACVNVLVPRVAAPVVRLPA